MTPCQAATAYAAAGYGAIVLTDKTGYSGPATADPGATCDTSGTNRVNVIPGYEDTQGAHFTVANVATLDVTASDAGRQQAVNYALSQPVTRKDGVFLAFAHPNFSLPAGWTAEQIESISGVNALEIWNGQGYDSSVIYDAVLASGKRLWLHSADDSYGTGVIDSGWDVVNADSNSTGNIMDALQNGRFYATRVGHAIRCTTDRQSITCTTYYSETDLSRWVGVFSWIGPSGKILRQSQLTSQDKYTVTGAESYARLVVTDAYGYQQVWSQPFYIDR